MHITHTLNKTTLDYQLNSFIIFTPLFIFQVCRSWNVLANSNDVWRIKCEKVRLEVPIGVDPDWKKLYKDNKYLRVNWHDGKYKITDFKGHTDRYKIDIWREASRCT